jgi:hypothetical protein
MDYSFKTKFKMKTLQEERQEYIEPTPEPEIRLRKFSRLRCKSAIRANVNQSTTITKKGLLLLSEMEGTLETHYRMCKQRS